eukprot:Hpha_TRINITY_DN31747_c0_g1::TRINITY_DN31747_c0_g1_i1::g.116397::m.116397
MPIAVVFVAVFGISFSNCRTPGYDVAGTIGTKPCLAAGVLGAAIVDGLYVFACDTPYPAVVCDGIGHPAQATCTAVQGGPKLGCPTYTKDVAGSLAGTTIYSQCGMQIFSCTWDAATKTAGGCAAYSTVCSAGEGVTVELTTGSPIESCTATGLRKCQAGVGCNGANLGNPCSTIHGVASTPLSPNYIEGEQLFLGCSGQGPLYCPSGAAACETFTDPCTGSGRLRGVVKGTTFGEYLILCETGMLVCDADGVPTSPPSLS